MKKKTRFLIGLSITAVILLLLGSRLLFRPYIDGRLMQGSWRLAEYDKPPIDSLTGFDHILYRFSGIGDAAIDVVYPDGRTETYDTSCYTFGSHIVMSGAKGTYAITDNRVSIAYENGTHEILVREETGDQGKHEAGR